ncbi:MAG: dTMP kinase [Alphaproteobacteria bacterium]|nr:dTMP kinase [Alphaproteobacteria bacterium]
MSATAEGKFITFEGGEGAGKSNHAKRLALFLAECGCNVLQTREPGGSEGAEQIRRLLVEGEPGRWTAVTEALLHAAARADHVARTIRPALAAGTWVISDRFTDSTMAYQGYGHGLALETIARLNVFASDGLTPDLTFVLDVPVEAGLARAGARADDGDDGDREDRYERMGRDFHQRLREGFLTIAEGDPERCVVVDTTKTVDDVAAIIREAAKARLLET